jgi:hypothetical protein
MTYKKSHFIDLLPGILKFLSDKNKNNQSTNKESQDKTQDSCCRQVIISQAGPGVNGISLDK